MIKLAMAVEGFLGSAELPPLNPVMWIGIMFTPTVKNYSDQVSYSCGGLF